MSLHLYEVTLEDNRLKNNVFTVSEMTDWNTVF